MERAVTLLTSKFCTPTEIEVSVSGAPPEPNQEDKIRQLRKLENVLVQNLQQQIQEPEQQLKFLRLQLFCV